MSGYDTEYLRDTVGDALARGMAATLAAAPADPVDYLGRWLHAYVKNTAIYEDYVTEKQQLADAVICKEESDACRIKAVASKDDRWQAALMQIAELDGTPMEIWKKAADIVVECTDTASAYVAVVTTAPEPDFEWPEEDEEEEGAETDDEAEEAAERSATPGEKPDAEDEENEDVSGEQELLVQDGDESEDTEKLPSVDPDTVVKAAWDYSDHHLEYIAAAPDHQNFLLEDHICLTRPASPPEDADEDYVTPPVPATLQAINRNEPSIYVRNSADEPSLQCLSGFPAIGAYYAAASVQSSGKFASVLCCDTVVPHGSAREISEEDRAFVWQVAQAVAQKLDNVTRLRIQARAESTVGQAQAELRSKLDELRGVPSVPLEGAVAKVEGNSAEGAGEEDDGDQNAEDAADDHEAEDADEEEADEEEEAGAAVQIEKISKRVAKLNKVITRLSASTLEKEQAANVEAQCMAAIKDHIASCKTAALNELHACSSRPPATFHVLRATLRLLQKDVAVVGSWHACLPLLNEQLFEQLQQYDASQPRDGALWKGVRSAYKAVQKSKGPEMWAHELPVTGLGIFLMMFIKQVRRTAKAADAARKVSDELATATASKEKAEARLESLETARAAAEAAAAAAAVVAEPDGGGEEQEGDEEGDED